MKQLLDHFEPVFANTEALKKEVFKIRHEVYGERLGWESVTESGLEYDEYDQYAFHYLVRHRRTGLFIGTSRLVVIDEESPFDQTPAERFAGDKLYAEKVRFGGLDKPKTEFSRITILSDWRQRIDNLTEEEKSFGNFAIMLIALPPIYTAISLNYTSGLAILERKFIRRLKLLGFLCNVVSEPIEHRGTRYVVQLLAHDVLRDITRDSFEIYDEIRKSITLDSESKGIPGSLGEQVRADLSDSIDK